MRLQAKLTANGGEGFIGGYADVDSWFWWFSKRNGAGAVGDASHWSPPSVYKAMRELADANPDPATGRNTAISMAIKVDLVAVTLAHRPDLEKASHPQQVATR
jgi:hypothetical protein